MDAQEEWDAARAGWSPAGCRRCSRFDRATAERRLMGMLARKGYGGGLAGYRRPARRWTRRPTPTSGDDAGPFEHDEDALLP